MAKPALGKGLGALISTRPATPPPAPVSVPVPETGERVQRLPLTSIVPSPLQPRTDFRAEQMQELMDSIREHGIIQPLIVRQVGDIYELIAGERRWRSAKELGLGEAPAIVREASDREVLELALIENLQRKDLNPMEEARGYHRLSKEYAMTQEEIAKRVGKSRASVANAVRLLDLAEQVQSYVEQTRLSVGHAKVLLTLKAHEDQLHLAETLIRQGASVRGAEKLVEDFLARSGKAPTTKKRSSSAAAAELEPALHRVQNLLQSRFSTRVVLDHGEKTGTIKIEYYGREDLDRLLSEFGVQTD